VERSARCQVRINEERLGMTVDRTVQREGDHFSVPLTVAFGNGRRWSAAAGMEYLSVSRREQEDWKFSDTSFGGTHYESEESASGITGTAALALHPVEPLQLGFVYRMPRDITGSRAVRVEEEKIGGFDVKLSYPERWGAGAALRLADRLTVAADLVYEAWSDFRHVGAGAAVDAATDDTWNWGVGVERQGGRLLGLRSPRLGYRRSTLPATGFGENRVREQTFSLGGGWVTGEGRALIDVSLELALRGNEDDHGARERVFRLGFSLTGREPWKEPSRRGPWWNR